MQKEIEIWLTPRQAGNTNLFKSEIANKLRISPQRIRHMDLLQRSIDARKQSIKIRLKFQVFIDEPQPASPGTPSKTYPDVSTKPSVVVVGMGPAGLFSALALIESGFKPILVERGCDVKTRKLDIARLSREHEVHPDSNYCFGEGGAGTFSDGKLYTRSTKRGNVREVLEILVAHGASPDILVDAHPHIGSDKLPAIITNIRNTILESGGEVHFNQRVTDLLISKNKARGVVTHTDASFEGVAVILATGHSARDVYELLHQKNIALEKKEFALGVRVEHPQRLIDEIQYHRSPQMEFLPAASYRLVKQVDGRGVFSFCMCPGGTIVPAATGQNQLVVNGMSNSRRNSPYANSGIVVQVEAADWAPFDSSGELAGIAFQNQVETDCWIAGGKRQTAPAQRLADFVNGKLSAQLPECSYHPGLASAPLHELLPLAISKRLQEGFKLFDRQMQGYLTNEAVVLGTESRTSSPVRIPRHETSLEHIQVEGLYPCGEGAGYAGGIVSSAIDGIRCANSLAAKQKEGFA